MWRNTPPIQRPAAHALEVLTVQATFLNQAENAVRVGNLHEVTLALQNAQAARVQLTGEILRLETFVLDMAVRAGIPGDN